MHHVPLSDVIGAARPRTYLVHDGKIVVRPREGEIDEGVRDFLKSIAKRVVSKGTAAIRKVLGKKPEAQKKAEKAGTQAPEPPEKTATPPTVSKADRAEQEAAKAKKRAAEKVRAAAAEADRPKTPAQKRAATVAAKRRAAMKAALDANKAARQKAKKAKVAAAELSGDKRASSQKDATDKAGKINAQLAHCILAVHVKRKKSVRGAWNICRASLTKHGYLKGPYREDGKVKDVKPTQKGARRAMQHANEKQPLNGGIPGSPPSKFQKFRRIFKDIEPTV